LSLQVACCADQRGWYCSSSCCSSSISICCGQLTRCCCPVEICCRKQNNQRHCYRCAVQVARLLGCRQAKIGHQLYSVAGEGVLFEVTVYSLFQCLYKSCTVRVTCKCWFAATQTYVVALTGSSARAFPRRRVAVTESCGTTLSAEL
jgi:hypothetical protein